MNTLFKYLICGAITVIGGFLMDVGYHFAGFMMGAVGFTIGWLVFFGFDD